MNSNLLRLELPPCPAIAPRVGGSFSHNPHKPTLSRIYPHMAAQFCASCILRRLPRLPRLRRDAQSPSMDAPSLRRSRHGQEDIFIPNQLSLWNFRIHQRLKDTKYIYVRNSQHRRDVADCGRMRANRPSADGTSEPRGGVLDCASPFPRHSAFDDGGSGAFPSARPSRSRNTQCATRNIKMSKTTEIAIRLPARSQPPALATIAQ